MASIDHTHTTLLPPVSGGLPTVAPNAGPPPFFDFNAPSIDVNGSVRLTGRPGEDIGGWKLGFVQLKYIGTNYARYRGTHDSHGSMLISANNQIVCRDTDVGSTEVWYDSLIAPDGAGNSPRGTNRLAAGTVLPSCGFLEIAAHLWDRPRRPWSSVEVNTVARGQPNNFLHHVDIGLAFCTMLVAQDPGNRFHLLKHFYWNVRWEQMFVVDRSGTVVAGRMIHLQHNIQRSVHSGSSMDYRFRGREFDLTLPTSNVVSRRAPRVSSAPDWRHM
jgi:hypothetical protein